MLLRIKTFFILLFFSVSGITQNNTDSFRNLPKEIKTAKNDASSIKIYHEWASTIKESNPILYCQINKKILEITSKYSSNTNKDLTYTYLKAKSLLYLGESYYQTFSYDSSLYFFSEALQLQKKLNDTLGIITCYKNLGDIYFDKGNPNKSIDYYLNCLLLVDKEDFTLISATFNGLGMSYSILEDYEMAEYYFKNSVQLFKNLDDDRGVIIAQNNLAIIYYKQKKYGAARNYFNTSIKWAEANKNDGILSASINGIGSIYYQEKNYDSALFIISKV